MKISSTYTVALQILMMTKYYEDEKLTSSFFSQRIGADPALIRRVMADMNQKWIVSKPGPGGTKLLKELDEICLYDIFKAVTHDDDSVLKFYEAGELATSFEEGLMTVTEKCFSQYISSFYSELKAHTVGDIYALIKKK